MKIKLFPGIHVGEIYKKGSVIFDVAFSLLLTHL